MKVECVSLVDIFGKLAATSGRLKIGGFYDVLSISIEPAFTRIRVVGSDSVPALFDPKIFRVVSNRIPANWIVASPEPGCLSIGPERWSRPGFWEGYFDGDSRAIAVFEEDRAITLAHDP
jgi:hypothetical protein